MGFLQEICFNKTVQEANLQDNVQLLLFVDKMITFDPKKKAEDILV